MIPTAQEYLDSFGGIRVDNPNNQAVETMIEFAKLHVEAALKSASEKCMLQVQGFNSDKPREISGFSTEHNEIYVSKRSILTAYPATKIK